MKGDRLTRKARYGIMAALAAGMFSIMPMVQAMPTGAQTSTATITTSGKNMNISGAANNLITWQSFSIGANEKVQFDNNNYLNYVRGSSRSDIMGTLTGGGNIYLVNPNGIVIGDGAQVNVGSLHLSTAELSGEALNSYTDAVTALSGAVNLTGDVINKGNIQAQAITVQGENITFKNVADVTADNVTLISKNSAHLGHAVGEEANAVNDTQYVGLDLTGETPAWTFKDTAGEALAPTNYALVRNEYELQNIQNNLSGNYMLANNIVLEVPAEGESNFVPIALDGNPWKSEPGIPFSGKFDGNSYTVANLTINMPESNYVGLFGYIYGNGAMVENVGVIDNNVIGYDYVGGVSGCLSGTGAQMRNVYNTGTISGHDYVGGVVGRYGESAVLAYAYNTGEVTGHNYVAGVAGLNTGGRPVEYCYNTGDVTGYDRVCGIFSAGANYAYNTGTISGHDMVGGISSDSSYYSLTNVYNTGDVIGTGDYVGGIAGKAEAASWNPEAVAIKNAYNIGSVSGGVDATHVGAVAGQYNGSSDKVQEIYYATDTGNEMNDSLGIGKTTEELMNPATFNETWNVSTNGEAKTGWRMAPGQTTPILSAFSNGVDVMDENANRDYSEPVQEVIPESAPEIVQPQPPSPAPVVDPVPKVIPESVPEIVQPDTMFDWRTNLPLIRDAIAYQGASLYSDGGGSGKESKGRFKGIKLEEGLDYYNNNTRLSFLSKGIKAPSAMSFYDILAMWSFTQ